jgi:hypothetical protein
MLLIATTCVATITGVAHASDVRLHITLDDDSEVQGELVEKVPNDHVTLKLATGEVRTIPWAKIANMEDASDSTLTIPTPTTLPHPSTSSASSSSVNASLGMGTPAFVHHDPATADHPSWMTPEGPPSAFGNHFYVGLSSGLGTPTGYGGVMAAWDLSSWFELEGGVGLGGKFGTGVGVMGRLELPLLDTWRMGLGLGFSENFLSASDRAANGDYPNAPRTAHWLNLEFIEMDIATGGSGFLRFSGGYAFLLNSGDYTAMCHSSTIGSTYDPNCEGAHTFPATPMSYASDAHIPFVPYVGIEYAVKLI